MLLHTLLKSIVPAEKIGGLPNIEISAIEEDSRRVAVGTLFVARRGLNVDGGAYAVDAAKRGAVAVISDHGITGCPLPVIQVPNAAIAASVLANTLAGDPSNSLRVIGVTGTNGKTTTTYLIRHILSKLDIRCGMIGTVEIFDGWRKVEASMTTPAAVDIASLLGTMKTTQCAACAMEVSSQGLHQQRVAGVKFAGAGFTNLTRDHLDYHKTFEDYAAAKAMLFESLDEGAVAVVNDRDTWTPRLLKDCRAKIFRFGTEASADYRAMDTLVTTSGVHFILKTPDGSAEVNIPLIGRHNLENALCAAALCGEVMGLSAHQIAQGLSDAQGAPGRLQAVRTGQPFAVLVDYAHTDDALKNVLQALRPLTRGKVRVVFGCGGDRDRTKRPKMARIAQQLADAVYITSDNPRTENPQSILDEILSGLATDSESNTGAVINVEIDRRKAIAKAIEDAEPNDVILLAGKGHENYQIIGKTKHHFDDAEEAIEAARKVGIV